MPIPHINTDPELRGVIFDLDGVIVDSHPVHRRAWRQFLDRIGLDVPEKELDIILDGRKRRDILRHFLGELSEQELQNFGRLKDDMFQSMQMEVPPVPGVLQLLGELANNGMKLAIVTSGSRSRAFSTLLHLGVKDLFCVIVAGEDVIAGKPDPSGYRLACELLQENAESLMAVEDAVSGVRAATAAGLRCLAVVGHESPENLNAAGAVAVVRDFANLSSRGLIQIWRNSLLGLGRIPASNVAR